MKFSVLRNVFEKNENAAKENRALFDANNVCCVNLLGGAGSGKTSVLESLIPILTDSKRIAVLEGDLATTRDAERIAALGVPVVQLLTEGGCHLNATLVSHALKELPLAEIDLLIIENVGNPICPANFDLGEHFRVAVLSVTEGDDKPSKYPLLFKDVAIVAVTKCDLLPFVRFNLAVVREDIDRINPSVPIIGTAVPQNDEPDGFLRLAEIILSRISGSAATLLPLPQSDRDSRIIERTAQP
ncbi:MAG: hydrogenase nickel incorporation protein HypB [Phycisphaerae bacterium]|nr:hydrogenase nickel incorporation protein HypB [Phycisphaerae bacterium]